CALILDDPTLHCSFHLEGSGSDSNDPECTAAGCYVNWQGDGACDTYCNIEECNYDNGDCDHLNECFSTECTMELLSNWECDPACNSTQCDFDDGMCISQPGGSSDGTRGKQVAKQAKKQKAKQRIAKSAANVFGLKNAAGPRSAAAKRVSKAKKAGKAAAVEGAEALHKSVKDEPHWRAAKIAAKAEAQMAAHLPRARRDAEGRTLLEMSAGKTAGLPRSPKSALTAEAKLKARALANGATKEPKTPPKKREPRRRSLVGSATRSRSGASTSKLSLYCNLGTGTAEIPRSNRGSVTPYLFTLGSTSKTKSGMEADFSKSKTFDWSAGVHLLWYHILDSAGVQSYLGTGGVGESALRMHIDAEDATGNHASMLSSSVSAGSASVTSATSETQVSRSVSASSSSELAALSVDTVFWYCTLSEAEKLTMFQDAPDVMASMDCSAYTPNPPPSSPLRRPPGPMPVQTPPSSPPPSAPSPPPPPNYYIWSASAWGVCSAECGGGSSMRTVSCMDSRTSVAVSESLCVSSARPASSESCNNLPCPSYEISYGSWGECSKTCGGGIQSRTIQCIEGGNIGTPVAVGVQHCSETTADPAMKALLIAGGEAFAAYATRGCSLEACETAFWSTAEWGRCNQTCGGGTQSRTVTCRNAANEAVPDDSCVAADAPISLKACNTHACESYVWASGPWGTCSVECSSGVQTRTVVCSSSTGTVADAAHCTNAEPSSTRACNTHACPDAAQSQAFQVPQASEECSGAEMADGSCCTSGLISASSECCAAGSSLDGLHECCGVGLNIDACGVCGGDSIVVAVDGTCCAGVLDAASMCCASGVLDECGICDGDDSTCMTTATAMVAMDDAQAAALQDPGSQAYQEYAQSYSQTAAIVLGVVEARVQVTSLQTSPSSRRLLLSTLVGVEFQVNAPSNGDEVVVSSKYLRSAFLEAPSDLGDLHQVGRVAVCGNSVCENREHCAEGQLPSTCCQQDCPIYSMKTCPSTNTLSCSGNGVCQPSGGSCECYMGYTADDCDTCAGATYHNETGHLLSIYYKDDAGVCALHILPATSSATSPPPSAASGTSPPPSEEGSEDTSLSSSGSRTSTRTPSAALLVQACLSAIFTGCAWVLWPM
ncbi:hypothetical protein CYMTET_20985, partial [Cymbomonas tetramitiformis]